MLNVRNDFPILTKRHNGHQLVYLDNAATTQKPRQVIQAVVDFLENHNGNPHRGAHILSVEASEAYDQACAGSSTPAAAKKSFSYAMRRKG